MINAVFNDSNIAVFEYTILHDVNDRQSGESSKKMKRTEAMISLVFENLGGATAHICIDRLNGNSEDNTCKNWLHGCTKLLARDCNDA